jgi:lysophospholipase L1-like esterase
VVCVGDSIRMGYEWVIAHNPDIVRLNAGLHDMARASGPGPENRVPIDEYRANMRKIVETIQQQTAARVIVALTTPVDLERQLAVEYGINRTLEDVALYNKVATTIAAELGVTVNDLFSVIADHGAGDLLAEDGVHFTPEGSVILGRAAAAAIRAAVEE